MKPYNIILLVMLGIGALISFSMYMEQKKHNAFLRSKMGCSCKDNKTTTNGTSTNNGGSQVTDTTNDYSTSFL